MVVIGSMEILQTHVKEKLFRLPDTVNVTSRTVAHTEQRNRVARMIAQMTWFGIRKCLLGDATETHLGFPNPHFYPRMPEFQPIRNNQIVFER